MKTRGRGSRSMRRRPASWSLCRLFRKATSAGSGFRTARQRWLSTRMVRRRPRTIPVESHLCLAVRNPDTAEVAFRKRRQSDQLAGRLPIDLDPRPRVFIRRHHAILPVPGKIDVGKIPGRFLDHLAFATRKIMARDVFELRALVRKEIEILRVDVEGLGVV